MVTSALLTKDPDSPPARIVELVRSGALTALVSADLLAEYREVLLRDRIRRRHGRSAQEIDAVLEELRANSRFVNPPDAPAEGPDPGDSHLWRLLRTEPGAVLITGDRALLDAPPSWATAVSPRQWLEELDNTDRVEED